MKPSTSSAEELTNLEIIQELPTEVMLRQFMVAHHLDERLMLAVSREWLFQGRLAQLPFFQRQEWRNWLIMGGRGSGKTRAGAEWISGMAQGFMPFADKACGTIALVGETLADVREVMVEGPSGLLAVSRHQRPRLESTRRRLVWESGAVASFYSSEDPESLRGPQFSAAWCDELAKWKNPQQTWDMLQFGLRLGDYPRQVITTTPRMQALLRQLLDDPGTVTTHMRTDENAAHLAPDFLQAMQARYGGTALGRQELDGVLIADRENALWTRMQLESLYQPQIPELQRIVIAVDPPATSTKNSDSCGIVVVGLDLSGVAWVLEDASLPMAKPHQWAARVVDCYHRNRADLVVAEVNQGGDMVSAVIHAQDETVAVKPVRAQRGKYLRAEPVAALYEQGRVRHARRFAELEDEMCDFAVSGLSSGRSPDRMDALVWALHALLLHDTDKPRIRQFR